MLNIKSYEEFIQTKTIKDLIDDRQNSVLVDGDENLTIQEAFNKFLEYNLRCMPIYRMKNGSKEYFGYVTLFDLIPFTIFKLLSENAQNLDDDDDANITENVEHFQTPIKEIIKNTTTQNRLELKILEETTTLRDLVNLLSQYNHHCLVKKQNNEYEVVSQFDIINYLFKNNEKIDDDLLDQQASIISNLVLKKRISRLEGRIDPEKLKLISVPPIITMSYKKPAIDGFKLMFYNRVDCVGIVDNDGSLISVLTSGNLRGFNPSVLKEVFKPVLPFLKTALDDVPQPYTCSEKYTLSQCITKLLRKKTRRLFVVDNDNKPIGIISMSDIVSSFVIEKETIAQ